MASDFVIGESRHSLEKILRSAGDAIASESEIEPTLNYLVSDFVTRAYYCV